VILLQFDWAVMGLSSDNAVQIQLSAGKIRDTDSPPGNHIKGIISTINQTVRNHKHTQHRTPQQ
jgi:hypothetical protein